MNTKKLAEWIESLKKAAKEDNDSVIFWFDDTKESKLSIIGGWMEGFSESWDELLCVSKKNPKYAMCIKIAVNEGPYSYTDFELMNCPENSEGEIEDTCIALEYEDDAEELAGFFDMEFERLMKELEEVAA